jgi:hypothetical protein
MFQAAILAACEQEEDPSAPKHASLADVAVYLQG